MFGLLDIGTVSSGKSLTLRQTTSHSSNDLLLKTTKNKNYWVECRATIRLFTHTTQDYLKRVHFNEV